MQHFSICFSALQIYIITVRIDYYSIKATFHYSSQLQTWFLTRFAARFSTSSCRFATCFRLFCRKPSANLLHQSPHVENQDWCSRFVGSCAC